MGKAKKLSAPLRRVYKHMSENAEKLKTLFEELDANADGKLSESEFVAGIDLENETARILFENMDVDGSGHLTKEEMLNDFKEGAEAYERSEFLRDALKKFIVLIFFALPIVCVLLAFIFGGLLKAAEGWRYEDCFYEVLASLSSTTIPVAVVPPAATDAGRMIGCLIGLYSLAVLGAVVGLLGGPLLDPVVEFLGMEVANDAKAPVSTALKKMGLFVFLGLPVVALVISLIFGAILAEVEGWSLTVGFYSVLAELTGTNIQVVDPPAPDSHGGKLVACLIGIWSISILGGVIGIMGGPLMDPLVEAIGAMPKAREVKDKDLSLEAMERKKITKVAPQTR